MRPHPKRAQTDPTSPRAWATDDRSGFVGNHEDTVWQYDWAGTRLVNTHILVYPDQLDEPQRQLGTVVLPPDPPSIMNARPEGYAIDELWEIMIEASFRHGSMPFYLESSTVSGNLSPLGMSLETSTID